jgi:DNA-binding transcriptional LysR family regulator
MLDPRRLLTFREVARQTSFSRAAATLFLTQPAVSQQIRALELQLGERLIERGRGGFALTPAGVLLLAHAEALHERLQLAESQLADASGEARRLLRIGAFSSALTTLVAPASASLTVEGGLHLTAVEGGTDDLVPAIRNGAVHVALCFQDASAPRREHDGTHRVDLLEEPMLAALGPGHKLAGRKRIRLGELADDPWLASARDGLIVRACVAAGFEPRLAYLINDPLAINSFVAAGLAVTLAPQLLFGHLRDVATAALAGEPVRRSIYAVTPQTGVHSLVGSFLAAVHEHIAHAALPVARVGEAAET